MNRPNGSEGWQLTRVCSVKHRKQFSDGQSRDQTNKLRFKPVTDASSGSRHHRFTDAASMRRHWKSTEGKKMGLDITAYRKLVLTPDAERDEDGELVDYDNYTTFYDNKDFPGRIEGITPKAAYKVEGDCCGLSAGYGGYNAWRNQLAQLAGYPLGHYEQYGRQADSYCVACWNGESGPFAEQINFSDCEGTIGPVVSAKLAKDYAAFAEKAEAIGGYFWEKYQEWKAAFECAADSGAVSFH
ncbi:hypothetical protein [Pseudomonas fluorescens]|uniref:hypothetical protein n=1 Tax=Pseudomonas fluorescens TaxID=294 RepID=UPI003D247FEF